MYDSMSGRFLGRDPLGLTPDLNTTRYCNGNPTTWTDAYGLEVPKYTEDDVDACHTFLKITALGAFSKYPCAAALLRKFIFRQRGIGCPESCKTALSQAEWEDRFSLFAGRYLEAYKGCGFKGRIDLSFHRFDFRNGEPAFEKDEIADLYFAFHEFTVASLDAGCSADCTKTAGCCCDCIGKCGAVLRIEDDYDFCSSFKPGKHLGFGWKLARCGCIVEDYRKKNGVKDGGSFKVSCNIGLKTEMKLNARVCGPQRSTNHPSVPQPFE